MTTPPGVKPPYEGFGHWPRTVHNVGFAATPHQLMTGCGLIIAITAIANTTTAPANGWLLDGTDATGEYLVFISMVAAGSFTLGPGMPGIPFKRGLYNDPFTGGYKMSVTYIPLDQPPD